MSDQPIRAVFFDAVGTLIHPDPDASAVYAEVGRRHGSRLGAAAIRQAFRAAFVRQDELDRRQQWRTSEAREVERWRSIVFEVLHDAADREGCFLELYDHFARPAKWRCEVASAQEFAALVGPGLRLGLASNFDQRLRRVLAGFPALAALATVIISAEVGWRKPAPAFFAAMCASIALPPQQVLYVGDDLENDFLGAQAAGCRAVLLDAGSKHGGLAPRVGALGELLTSDLAQEVQVTRTPGELLQS
jgi:putative hydrolase of the HAD superfamily